MKRLGIFAFYDVEGYVDYYIEYLLNDITSHVDRLIIVCNGQLDNWGRDIFLRYTNEIYIRDNQGFDGGAYQDVIVNYLGVEELRNWEELILFNDTFYGPVYPFLDIFTKMGERPVDFWGLLEHGPRKSGATNIDEHIQSYFLVVRENMLHSREFSKFWQQLGHMGTIDEAVQQFELTFTRYFTDYGYEKGVYCDVTSFESKNNFEHCNWSIWKPLALMRDYKYPIIKKKTFLFNKTMTEQGKDILEYLQNDTAYPVQYIWEHMLRINNIADVQSGLGLEYIRGDDSASLELSGSVAVFIHLYYEDMVEDFFQYIKEIPQEIDIYISTANEITLDIIRRCALHQNNIKKIILLPNRGRDIAALLIGLKPYIIEYEIFCFIHDKKSQKGEDIVNGENFLNNMWDNLLKSEGYIRNIIQVLQSNRHVGLLVPPYPLLQNLNYVIVDAFGEANYHNMIELAERLDIKSSLIDRTKRQLALGTTFWCKTKSLMPLLETTFTLEEFIEEPLPRNGTMSHAVERILPFVAQHMGYGVGVIEHVSVVEKRIIMERELLRTAMIPKRTYSDIINDIKTYLLDKEDCYIYGNGKLAERLAFELRSRGISYKGHIVTNQREGEKDLFGREVYSVADMQINSRMGILLGVSEQYVLEVEEELQKRGMVDYCIIK